VVRRLVGTDQPRFSGATVYRGLIPIDRVPWLRASAKVVVWLGPGQHCVCYPVSGGRAVSVSATSPAVTPPPQSASSSAEALATYAGWHEDVAGLLAAADRLTRWALYDRAPLARWCTQRCVVIGDAAHPMLPFIAQGATQAIEDAVTVAACLRSADKEDPAGALRRYEQIRRPRIGRVDAAVIASVRDHHLADGARQRQRDRRLGEAGGVAGLHWLYGHDAERAAREVAVHPL